MKETFKAKLQKLGFQSYQDYLISPHWISIRDKLHTNPLFNTCLICRSPYPELHHRNYKNLGAEKIKDLIPLCRSHHQAYHDFLKEHPKTKLGDTVKIFENLFGLSKSAADVLLHRYLSPTNMIVVEPIRPLPPKEVKIRKEGQECRHCGDKVYKVERNKPPKKSTAYFYSYWFKCGNCKAIYLVPSAKKFHKPN